MINIPELEKQYLDAKIAYYEGRQIMKDSEFDFIERILKEHGSKVVEQVGSKRKDFDYPMRSLAKLQTEEGNNMKAEFESWYSKRVTMLGEYPSLNTVKMMYSSAKFDGNAINIIYKNNELYQVLTRGDGAAGKNITDRMQFILPKNLLIGKQDVGEMEIRCEVVIDKNVFEEKYADTFANPRNFVAGILGGDEFDEDVINDLIVVPLQFLLDGENVRRDSYISHLACSSNIYTLDERDMQVLDYEEELNYWVNTRDKFPFQLDGVVIAFHPEYRAILGENDHDPEWAIAIKFVAEESVTTYSGLEWNVGKTGELAPVVLLNPVKLAGTTVKRASGYNAGFIMNRGIGPGAVFSIIKAGDIIPEIKTIVTKCTDPVSLPTHCPDCNSELAFDGIHLVCNNEECPGRVAKILASGLLTLKIKRVGRKTVAPFAKDFSNLIELIVWARAEGDSKDIEKYGIPYKSRSHEIFLNAFKNITSIPYAKVIQVLGYTNVGKTLSAQIANEHAGVAFDYGNLEKALVESMRKPEVTYWIKHCVKLLEDAGVVIDRPKLIDTSEVVFVCLTGSPSSAGYKTKEDFLTHYGGKLVECKISDKNCKYLVTNDLNSKTSKMMDALKRGIKIVPYTHEF